MILCCGNIVQDILVRPVSEVHFDRTTWVDSIQFSLGGNGANTSYAAAILGVPVRLLGFTGKDDFSPRVLETLRKPGVDTGFVRQVDGQATATSVVLVHPSGSRAFLHQPGVNRVAFAEPVEFTPELITGHLNFRDRQTHFIFGDASVALVVERMEDGAVRPGRFEVLDTRSWTQFSNNIRTNFGYLLRAGQDDTSIIRMEGNMITQVGNKVFKEVIQAATRFISEFLGDNGLTTEDVRRYWLHQANARMNAMIMKLVLGYEADQDRAPTVLDRLGNTAGAGAVIALKENHADLKPGDHGLLCAFGAGYSIGATVLRMM